MRWSCILLALAVILFAHGDAAQAQSVSSDQIIKALKPPAPGRVTRGLTAAPADAGQAEQRQFLNSLRNRSTRALTMGERQKLSTIAKSRPSIDLEIKFAYNSAEISDEAIPDATALGEALSHPDLAGNSFILAGHTDAKGSAEYNQALSEQRAEEVRQFLIEHFGIEANRLVAVGYGKTQLKLPQNPFGDANRRVQVVNAGQ
jgi:outer membrane protein OmpA-like peptidoglycan-associated protein